MAPDPDPILPADPEDLYGPRPPHPVSEWVALCVGGGLGACARWQIDLVTLRAAPALSTTIPISTWTVNCVGAFLLGALLVLLDRRGRHPLLRPFLAVGFLGSFTTFSTFALESRALAGQFGTLVGVAHAALMVATGYLAYAGGASSARRGSGTARRPRRAS